MVNLNENDFVLDEIESIELIGEDDTIDISVEDTHMFFANNIYTHNCSINSELVEASQMGGSIKKVQIGHFIMSFAKTLDQRENSTGTIAILKSRFGKDGIVFRNCQFDNGKIQIETGEDDGGIQFSKMEEVKKVESNSKISESLLAAQAKKRVSSCNV
jgi:hypothetical protein